MPLGWFSDQVQRFLKGHVKQEYYFSMIKVTDDTSLLVIVNDHICQWFHNLGTVLCYAFQDTEFPGVVARPIGEFRSTADYQYQLLRCNVDLLKIIQIGFTFMDENGNTPKPVSTWQFNFKFNLQYVLHFLNRTCPGVSVDPGVRVLMLEVFKRPPSLTPQEFSKLFIVWLAEV